MTTVFVFVFLTFATLTIVGWCADRFPTRLVRDVEAHQRTMDALHAAEGEK